MLENIKLTRCAAHDCPACPVCRLDRAEAHERGDRAMHDLLVWMACHGLTELPLQPLVLAQYLTWLDEEAEGATRVRY